MENAAPDDDIIRDWWEDLTPRDAAALRHCSSLIEVAVHRQGLALMRRLPWPKSRLEYGAGLAQVLAHVKKDDHRPIMAVCGFRKWRATKPELLSERRFERLLATRAVEDLTVGLIRLVQMMDGRCNVAELGQWMRWWPREGDSGFNRVLRQVAQDYYAADIPA
ncbi:MAG: type I-E CRISPR-associated protein Cse2/CasB [Hyphomicrobiaceae bacterium]